jgi:hypothetical protein
MEQKDGLVTATHATLTNHGFHNNGDVACQTVHFISTTIGLPENQHLTGYCQWMNTMALKVLGGSA